MKKILFILCLFFSTQVQAQPKPQAKDTTYIKGKAYPVYVGSRGGQYIIVTKKDGSGTYKKYLPQKPLPAKL